MYNLFFIITPIQYLNALELINYFKIKNENNVLINMSVFHKNRDEITSMLELNNWLKIHTISKNKSSVGRLTYFKYLFQAKRQLNKIFTLYPNNSKLIICNYNNLLIHFILQNHNYEQLFLIDDGLASMEISHIRFDEVEKNYSILEIPRMRSKRLQASKKILRLKNFIPNKINFFSAYDIVKNPNDNFYVNEYSRLRSNIIYRPQGKIAYFIGQPLTELKIISDEFYLKTIEDLVNENRDVDFYYIPHRIEKLSKMNKLAQNIKIKNFDLPIELAISQENILPYDIYTFYSSAIFNLNIIYGNLFRYYLIKIPQDKILSKNILISDLYKKIEKHNSLNINFNEINVNR